MQRVLAWLRGLPIWGKVLLGVALVAAIAAAVSPPDNDTSVDSASTTSAHITTTSKGAMTTLQAGVTPTTALAARATTTKRPLTATTRKENARCLAVPASTTQSIASGLTVDGGGTLRFVRAVKSKDFESAYFVTADIQGSGLGGKTDLGTWVVNRIEGDSQLIYSVNAVAKEFSEWGDGATTDAEFGMSDDGADDSVSCSKAIAT